MELRQLISHWNQVRAGLLATMDKFKDAELAYVPFEGGWSVGQILLHIAHEEDGEIRQGITRELLQWPSGYAPKEYPTMESIKTLLTKVHSRTEQYLQTLDDGDLDRDIETPWNKTIQLRMMIWHVLEHEIHHRGELSLILGMLGHEGLDA